METLQIWEVVGTGHMSNYLLTRLGGFMSWKNQKLDYAWKGFTVMLSIIIVPCFMDMDSRCTWSSRI